MFFEIHYMTHQGISGVAGGNHQVCPLTASANTAGCIFFTFYPDLDNISCSAHSWGHGNSPDRAIVYTSPAFHASIKICNPHSAAITLKHTMGTNLHTKSAAHTIFPGELEGCHII